MRRNFFHSALPHILKILKNGFWAWLYVAKLTIPAMILTRLLLVFDLIPHVATFFEPVMALVGLPAETALIWVGSILGNLYVAISIYISLIPIMEPLSVAQISILAVMCLVGHALIIEGQVCRAAGISAWRVTLYRIVSAIILGLIIHHGACLIGWGAEPAVMLSALELSGDTVPPWLEWAWSSAQQLLGVLVLVEVLMLMMDLIKYLNLTRLIAKVLGPPLRFAGVGDSALMVTVIGCVVGLAYGSSLIIAESRSGNISNKDIYNAVMFMAIFHGILEDTVLMWALGADLWCIIGVRLIFALGLSAVLTRLAWRPGWRKILVGDMPSANKLEVNQ